MNIHNTPEVMPAEFEPKPQCSSLTEGIRDSRPLFYYPTDPRLPWHFSWIDDGMMAGMSAPTEPHHYRALADAGVGLIVNLTEAPIAPLPTDGDTIICDTCEYIQEPHPTTLYDDLHPTDSLDVLFLPIHDGTTPQASQVHIFLKHAKDYIRRGKKVAVHCQAGVGRTGLFLALYLLTKHNISAQAAINRLRRIRPQSMRFHRKDWATDPFDGHLGEVVGSVREEDLWNVNSEQIRFVEGWMERADGGLCAEMEDEKVVDRNGLVHDSTRCYACRAVGCIGPSPIRSGVAWPSSEKVQGSRVSGQHESDVYAPINLDKVPMVQTILESYRHQEVTIQSTIA
ncbi:hypothetical protein HDV00_000126 [Rhizophlyctis rosea]|nr:hypothetical protein HDV00_000126 [Rhizophlyctis rosea]